MQTGHKSSIVVVLPYLWLLPLGISMIFYFHAYQLANSSNVLDLELLHGHLGVVQIGHWFLLVSVTYLFLVFISKLI